MQRQRFGISDTVGEADRKVSPQPLVYKNNEGVVSRFNLRKFSELAHHMVKAEMFEVYNIWKLCFYSNVCIIHN